MSYEESILKRKLTFPEVLIYGNKYNTVSSDGKIAYIINLKKHYKRIGLMSKTMSISNSIMER